MGTVTTDDQPAFVRSLHHKEVWEIEWGTRQGHPCEWEGVGKFTKHRDCQLFVEWPTGVKRTPPLSPYKCPRERKPDVIGFKGHNVVAGLGRLIGQEHSHPNLDKCQQHRGIRP